MTARDRYGEPVDQFDDPKQADSEHARLWIDHIRRQLAGDTTDTQPDDTQPRPDLASPCQIPADLFLCKVCGEGIYGMHNHPRSEELCTPGETKPSASAKT